MLKDLPLHQVYHHEDHSSFEAPHRQLDQKFDHCCSSHNQIPSRLAFSAHNFPVTGDLRLAPVNYARGYKEIRLNYHSLKKLDPQAISPVLFIIQCSHLIQTQVNL